MFAKMPMMLDLFVRQGQFGSAAKVAASSFAASVPELATASQVVLELLVAASFADRLQSTSCDKAEARLAD